MATDEAKMEHLLRKAETILKQRTDKVLLVLERVLDNTNYLGCLRTAEILGIQNVWVVQLPRGHKKNPQQNQGVGQGGVGKRRKGNKRKQPGDQAEEQQQEQQQQHDNSSQQQTEQATPAAGGPGQQQQAQPCSPSATAPDAQQADQVMGVPGGGDEAGGDVPIELLGIEEGDVAEDKLRQEIRKRLRFSRASSQWLDVRFFWSVDACITALKEDGWTIWATDLSKSSVSLTSSPVLDPLPDKVAIVMGREADGVSQQMLAQADRRVYLPMFGFTASLNVMVATGMVLQSMLTRWPQIRGSMSQDRREALRADWYVKLARNDAQKPSLLLRASNPPAAYDDDDMKDLMAREQAGGSSVADADINPAE